MPFWKGTIFGRKTDSNIGKRPSDIFPPRTYPPVTYPGNLGGLGGFGGLSRSPSYTNPPFDFNHFDQYEAPKLQMNISQIFNNNNNQNAGLNPNTNIEGLGNISNGLENMSSPTLGGLRNGLFNFDAVPSNPNLPKPQPTTKPGSYQPTQYITKQNNVPKNFDPSRLFDLGRTGSLMTAIGQHQDNNNDLDQPQLPYIAPAFNRDNSFQTMKGFSNFSQAQIGNSQLRPSTSGGFGGGGLGGAGFGAGGVGMYASNQSAFSQINNGLNKTPSNVSTSMSKLNSVLGNYGNLYTNFGKPSNDYQDLLQRFNNNSASTGQPSPAGLSLGRHPSMRDQIALEDTTSKVQK